MSDENAAVPEKLKKKITGKYYNSVYTRREWTWRTIQQQGSC